MPQQERGGVIRRIVVPAIALVGLVVIGLAVVSATVAKPPAVVTVEHTVGQGSELLVSDPGVLEAFADIVKIEVSTPNPDGVLVSFGRDTDVLEWVADTPNERLTGLASMDSFQVVNGGSDDKVVAAASSDLWVMAREFTTRDSLTWEGRSGRWSMLIAPLAGADGEFGPLEGTTVAMTWQRQVDTPWLVPGVALGTVILAASLILLVIDVRRHRALALSSGREEVRHGGRRRKAKPTQVKPDQEPVKATKTEETNAPGLEVGRHSEPTAEAPPEAREKRFKKKKDRAGVQPAGPESPPESEPETGPASPLVPAAPGAPVQPVAPVSPVVVDKSVPPTPPVAPTETPESTPSAPPPKPETLARPPELVKSMVGAKSVEPDPPVAPAQPLPPVKPLDPGLPLATAKPAEPASPVTPLKPVSGPPAQEPQLAQEPTSLDAELVIQPGKAKRGQAKPKRGRGKAPKPAKPAKKAKKAGPSEPTAPTPAPDQEVHHKAPAELDLGRATPVRSWERFAQAETSDQERPTEPILPAFGAKVDPVLGPIAAPARPAETPLTSLSRPVGLPLEQTSPALPPPSAPRGAAQGPSSDTARRNATAAEQIEALRATHSPSASQAASTIAAAVAAAQGTGSAVGLTRRQIREAERAAQEALRASRQDPFSESGAPAGAVQMQDEEGL